MSFDANLTRRRRRRGFANSQIARQYNLARIYGRRVSSYSGCTRAADQTRGENGSTNVRELMYGVCPQRNANSNTNATAAWRDSLDLRTCQTRSSGPRVLSTSTHVHRYTINEIASGDARNLIGYWYFYLYDVEWAVQERPYIARIHEKYSILSIHDTGIGIACDHR